VVELDYSPVRHQIDSFVQKPTVLTTHVIAAPLVHSFTLPLGIIRHVQIVFPIGCNRNVVMQIFHHGNQWLPGNLASTFSEMGHSHPIELDVYRDVWEGQTDFEIRAWGNGACYCNHAIHVYFTCELSEVL